MNITTEVHLNNLIKDFDEQFKLEIKDNKCGRFSSNSSKAVNNKFNEKKISPYKKSIQLNRKRKEK